MSSNYLFEIGTEELPPKSLLNLSNALTLAVKQSLSDHALDYKTFTPFCTPRRLAFHIDGLDDTTPLKEVKVWGPPAKVAYDKEGNATKAALSFCQRNNIGLDQLATESDGKVEKLVCNIKQGGESTTQLLPTFIETALNNLPIPKRMRWGSSRTEFVRPVHWLILLKDSDIIECEILGLSADRITRGHRFLSSGNLNIDHADQYEEYLMEQGKVIADFNIRQEKLKKQVIQCAQALKGTAIIDSDLLDEVTGLVEWPNALSGGFDKTFLDVPPEALISSMKEHQKYFHIIDDDKNLMPFFITVSNLEAKDYSAIISGNEKVIRPRLADAAFFFNTDKKISLQTRREKLKTVVFQAQLGSIFDKTERIKTIAKYISAQLSVDDNNILRTAELCKSDLVSHMVYEFPELQGIAGYHYALNDNENTDVAKGITEHYLPKFSGDELPKSKTGAIVALADRIDTITGIFGIGQIPTGSKDPFALRRASLGVLRLLVELQYPLDLKDLISVAANNFSDLPKKTTVVSDVLNYITDRFKAWYEEANIPGEVFQSVSCKNLTNPFDIHNRVHAVALFNNAPESIALASANKRVANILSKLDTQPSGEIDTQYLQLPEELNLTESLNKVKNLVSPLCDEHKYQEALALLSQLRDPVDAFFEKVMVMDEDMKLRKNRLILLSQLRELFLQIADISYLVPSKN